MARYLKDGRRVIKLAATYHPRTTNTMATAAAAAASASIQGAKR
jgi:hypothetical protein